MQLQKREELAGEKLREVADNAIKSCAVVIIICRRRCPITSEQIALDMQVAEDERKPMMLLGLNSHKFMKMKTGAYQQTCSTLLQRPDAFKCVHALSPLHHTHLLISFC